MHPRPGLSQDLTVHYARLLGAGAERGVLERALASLHANDVTERGEILFVPHLRAQVALSAAKPPAYFAAQLSAQLLQMRRDAVVNPAGFTDPRKALRFTSRANFASWVLSGWLRGGEAAAAVFDALEGQTIQQWQRRYVLADARLLVKVVTAMTHRALLTRWAMMLSMQDIAVAHAQLVIAYAIEPPDSKSAAYRSVAESAKSSAQIVGSGAGRRKLRYKGDPVVRPSLSLSTQLAAAALAKAEALGNDWSAITEHARQFLVTALCLADEPNAGKRISQIDWKTLWQIQAKSSSAEPPVARSHSGAPDAIPGDIMPFPHGPLETSRSPRQGLAITRTSREQKPETQTGQARFSDKQLSVGSAKASDWRTGLPDAPIEKVTGKTPQFETGFGGLFYLINIFIAMGLYPDFTRPMDKGLDVSPFWLLDRLALRTFGSPYRADSLHRWLRSVAHGGRLPDHWAVDRRWVGGNAGPFRTSLHDARGRLILWDVRGFPLLDISNRRTALCAHLRRSLRWAGRPSTQQSVPAVLRRMPLSAPARYLASLGAFIDFRMALAAPGLSAMSLQMPARVFVEDDLVSVSFALASLPLALRIAGLDRNPGWLPAEGRDLSFEFL